MEYMPCSEGRCGGRGGHPDTGIGIQSVGTSSGSQRSAAEGGGPTVQAHAGAPPPSQAGPGDSMDIHSCTAVSRGGDSIATCVELFANLYMEETDHRFQIIKQFIIIIIYYLTVFSTASSDWLYRTATINNSGFCY
jgi:hypothetical protein